MHQYVIAVDPGLTGAVAVMHRGGGPVWLGALAVHDMPVVDSGKGFVSRVVDAIGLAQIIRKYVGAIDKLGDYAFPGARAVMERVGAMPSQGVSSMFSLGDSRGCIRGVIQALGVPLTDVPPQTWKRDMDLISPKLPAKTPKTERDRAKREAKVRSRTLAAKLYPEFAHLLQREKDHGRAEALLIGHWALTKGA